MKRQTLLVAALIALVIAAGAWWYLAVKQPAPTTTHNANTAFNANAAIQLPTKITYQGQDGKTALDLLQEQHRVIEDNGFVNGIDGRVNSKTTYWLYYVNDEAATVGAKDYVTKSSDTIEWRFGTAQ